MAAGTLYGAIENLLKWQLIKPVQSEDKRRKVYVITKKGRQILQLDYQRIKHITEITESKITRREDNEEI